MRLRESRIELQRECELLDCQCGFAEVAVCNRKIAAIGRMIGALHDRAQQQLLGMFGLPDFKSQKSGTVKSVRIVRRRGDQFRKHLCGPAAVSGFESAERLSDQLGVIRPRPCFLRGKTPFFLTHRTRSFRSVFGPEVREFYVIDVASGAKIPRRGGSGIAKSDLLGIDQVDPAFARAE